MRPEKGTTDLIIVDEIVSADGFAARSDGSIDFFVDIEGMVDSVGNSDRMARVSAVLLGAQTYLEFRAYWPSQRPDADVNRLPKHVLSRSLFSAPWGELPPATVEHGTAAEVTRRLAERFVMSWRVPHEAFGEADRVENDASAST